MPKLTDPDVKRAGLVALVASGMRAKLAYESLKQQGIDVPERTLNDWKQRYPEELQRLHDQYAPQIEQQLVRQSRDVAVTAHEVALLAVEKTREKLEADELKDPAGAARNLEVVAATAIDKMLILTGRPDKITGHREPTKLIASLASKGISISVNNRALPETATSLADTADGSDRCNLPTVAQ